VAPQVVVIGNGLIGSAAARWLTELGAEVTVIGSAEPVDQSRHEGVFASHYDEGRLVSAHSPDPTWSQIARRAIARFAELERRSGVAFHHPVGRVSVVSPNDADAVRSWAARVDPGGHDLRVWAPGDATWKERFPYLVAPNDAGLLHEGAPAGVVNPRAMIRAQNALAARGGAEVVSACATSLRATAVGVDVSTAEGRTIRADRALVAAGAFTNFGGLVAAPVPLRLKTETTVWGAVSAETAQRWSTMAAITWDIDDPDIDDIYLAPPLRYPDGVYRVKMGSNTTNESWPTTLDEVGDWFRNGESDADLEPMERALHTLLPGFGFGELTTHRCIVAYTPSGYPTIDRAPGDDSGRVFVAVGGNGTGAQGSDELGCLGAGLVFDGRWPDELERDVFGAHHRWDEPSRRSSNARRRARDAQSADTA